MINLISKKDFASFPSQLPIDSTKTSLKRYVCTAAGRKGQKGPPAPPEDSCVIWDQKIPCHGSLLEVLMNEVLPS